MALPRLNESAQYTMKIPSTGEEIKYRPFLVKEQKILLMAQESQDSMQIMNALLTCIENCTQGINVFNLATFDADYMFTQIRSKSVGESATLSATCSSCEEQNNIKIDMDKIKIDVDSKLKNVVELTPSVSVKMKYPTYNDFIQAGVLSESSSVTEALLNTIVACMESIMTPEDNILIRDEAKEEVEEFLNSLTTEQFDKISEFVKSIPKMYQKKEYTCSNCGTKNKLELEGLNDFFM